METFIKQQKVILPEKKDGENNQTYALTINRNFNEYGFTLSSKAIDDLSGCSVDDIAAFYQEAMHEIKNFLGSELFAKTEPFYKNFPEEVMRMDEAQLYMNALVYYFMQYDFDMGQEVRDAVTEKEKVERPPVPEPLTKELKVLEETTLREMSNEYRDKLHGIGVSSSDMDTIKEYISKHPKESAAVVDVDAPFASNETKVKTAVMLKESLEENQNKNTMETLKRLLPKTNDILRFYAVLGAQKKGVEDIGKEANLSFSVGRSRSSERKNINFPYSISNKDKRFIRELLLNSSDLYEGVWMHKEIWQKIFTKYLGINEKSPKALKDVKDNLYKGNHIDALGRTILSPNAQMNLAQEEAQKGDVEPLNKVVKKYPGLYVQRFNETFHKVLKSDDLTPEKKISMAKEMGKNLEGIQIDPVKIMSLRNLMNCEANWDDKIVTTKTGKVVAVENENRSDKLIKHTEQRKILDTYQAMLSEVNQSFEKCIEANCKDTKAWGKVYIDPELSNRKMPQRNERTASKNSVMPRNSEIPCDHEKNLIIFGISWKGKDVDMDLSVTALDSNLKEIDTICYYELTNSFGIHSGDYISAPSGAQELVMVDKEAMKESGVKYLTARVYGYSSEFDSAEEPVRFISTEKDGNIMYNTLEGEQDGPYYGKVLFNGEVLNPAEFKNNIVISGDEREMIPVIYDVSEDKFVWVDEKEQIAGIANAGNQKSIGFNQSAVLRAEQSIVPSMSEVIESYAKYSSECEIVDDPQEADVIFFTSPQDVQLKDGAVVHTALDTGYFAASLATLQTTEEVSPNVQKRRDEEQKSTDREEYGIEH